MNKIMFNERYGLQSAVFEGRKTQTRREPFYSDKEVGCMLNKNGKLECYNDYNGNPIHTSHYAVGEIVAIAQSYSDIFDEADADYWNDKYSNFRNAYLAGSKGWKNKMFVKAELMTHHIKILDIRCERLHDISAIDCISEGIKCFYDPKSDLINRQYEIYWSAKEAFRSLITKLNGKKFCDSNPYVIVYEFEKID